jgi:2,4-diaminopentanoate dehydrogenase
MTEYRVVQWATGNIGTRALRSVIEHPGLSLAGVYVHSQAKAGRPWPRLSRRNVAWE